MFQDHGSPVNGFLLCSFHRRRVRLSALSDRASAVAEMFCVVITVVSSYIGCWPF